jgi:hypothetical protein
LLVLALALCGVSGWRLWQKNNSDKVIKDQIEADERAIALATRFGYSLPNAYKSLGSALKALIEQSPKKKLRGQYENRLDALKKSAARAKSKMKEQQPEELY